MKLAKTVTPMSLVMCAHTTSRCNFSVKRKHFSIYLAPAKEFSHLCFVHRQVNHDFIVGTREGGGEYSIHLFSSNFFF